MSRRTETMTWFLTAVAIIAIAPPVAVQAQQAIEGRVNESRVNVRLHPEENGLIIATISPDTTLEVLEERAGWVKVVLPAENGVRRTGFVASRLIDLLIGNAQRAATTAHQRAALGPEQLLHAAVHPGRVQDPGYWRQVVKVLRVLERRHRDRFNLISPVLSDELRNIESAVPKRSSDRQGDIDEYKRIATEILGQLDDAAIDWRLTLSAVEPEKGIIGRLTKRAAVIAIYSANPLAGEAARRALK